MARRGRTRRLLHLLEAAGVYGVYAAFRLLPVDAASALGGWLGRTIGPRLPVTRRAEANARRAFPDMPPDEIEGIIRGMWDNLGRTVAEYPRLAAFWDGRVPADRKALSRRLAEWQARSDDPVAFRGGRIEIAGIEYVRQALEHDGPKIFFSAHMGNWDVMPLWAARVGMPVAVVYRTPNNPHVARLLRRIRAGNGPLLPKGVHGALASVRVLEEGGCLGMLIDQKQNRGVPVPFFGRPAMTAPMLAKMMLRFRCPAFGAWVQRLDGARLRLTFAPPLVAEDTGDEKADVLAILTRVNGLVEEWIRERPDQWMWLHRRWPEEKPARGG